MRSLLTWKVFFVLIIVVSSFIFSIPTILNLKDTNNWFYEKKNKSWFRSPRWISLIT